MLKEEDLEKYLVLCTGLCIETYFSMTALYSMACHLHLFHHSYYSILYMFMLRMLAQVVIFVIRILEVPSLNFGWGISYPYRFSMCEIWGSHRHEDADVCLMSSNTVWTSTLKMEAWKQYVAIYIQVHMVVQSRRPTSTGLKNVHNNFLCILLMLQIQQWPSWNSLRCGFRRSPYGSFFGTDGVIDTNCSIFVNSICMLGFYNLLAALLCREYNRVT